MSKTITTDWQRVAPAQTTQLDLTDISRYLSARVRWRGVHREYTEQEAFVNTGAGSAVFPSLQNGGAFIRHYASGSVTISNPNATPCEFRLRLNVNGTVYDGSQQTLAPGGSTYTGMSSPDIYSYMPGSSVTLSVQYISGSANTSGWSASAYIVQNTPKTQDTVNPAVAVAGNAATHSGELVDGVITDWYTLNGLDKGVNLLAHSMGNTHSKADIQIEYTVEPLLPYTVQTLPAHATSTTDTTLDFVFTLTADSDNSATKYHAQIRLANYSTMPDAVVYESKTDQTNWQYWDGAAWQAFPAAGVDPGTQVKYTKTFPLSTIYWDTASWDGYFYGWQTTPYKVRLVLSADSLYILEIGGVRYDALSLAVVETSNGEIGGITAALDNKDGTAFAAVDFGDILLLAISVNGVSEDFEAVVREKSPQGNTVVILAITGDGILAERLCTADYTSQDIGVTVAAIITTYCAPLTAANVDTSTGFVAPVLANGKSPLSVLEELRKNYGLYYYVDKNWDLHLYKTDAVSTDASIQIRLGE